MVAIRKKKKPFPMFDMFNEAIVESEIIVRDRVTEMAQEAIDKIAIIKIEAKFLDGNLRSRSDHPAKALSPEERTIYADYLESIGQPKGATSFRQYNEIKKSVSAKGKAEKLVKVQLFNLSGEMEFEVEVIKGATSYETPDGRQFLYKDKKQKTKFYESAIRMKL